MTIEIKDLTFYCIIGILEHERTTAQRVIVDAVIKYDFEQGFIDYSAVTRTIKEVMTGQQFQLIEDAQNMLHSLLYKQFSAMHSLHLTIVKPDILSDCTVGVTHFSNFKKN